MMTKLKFPIHQCTSHQSHQSQRKSQKHPGCSTRPEAIENEIAKGPVLALEEFDWLRNEDWEDVDSIMDDAFVATVDSVF